MIKLAKNKGKAEIFHSLQGEGIHAGRPAIFVRTSLCNLHCIWCDTDYTWNWEGTNFPHEKDGEAGYRKFQKQEQIIEIEEARVVELIQSHPCQYVIFTGGEPMLQQIALTQIAKALQAASEHPYYFAVETNGTILPESDFLRIIDQFNVSPKLENSKNPQKLRLKEKPLRFFAKQANANFKFVVTQTADVFEIQELINQFHIPKEKVWLMPEGRDLPTLQRRSQWLWDHCVQNGYRFSNRLHVQVYDDKRGI